MKKRLLLIAGLCTLAGCDFCDIVGVGDLWNMPRARWEKARYTEIRIAGKEDKAECLKNIDENIRIHRYEAAELWMQRYYDFYGRDNELLKRVMSVADFYRTLKHDPERIFYFGQKAIGWKINLVDETIKRMRQEGIEAEKRRINRLVFSSTQPVVYPSTQPTSQPVKR